jgi:hypothetical protein
MKVYSMQICSEYKLIFHRRQLIATGDSEGFIKVWRLNDDLTIQCSQELDILNDLAETQAD